MVYVIAAYTITVGVLALYGLTMRHRECVAAAERLSASPAAASESVTAIKGFNLGASLLAPVWMWAHGLRLPGLGVLGACLALGPLAIKGLWTPFVFVAMVPVAAGCALGFVGNRIASQARGLAEPSALSASQLPWAIAGIVLHVFVLPWLVYFFVL